MSVSPEEVMRAELEPGERLIWAGGPRRHLDLRSHRAVLIMGAGVAVWTFGAWIMLGMRGAEMVYSGLALVAMMGGAMYAMAIHPARREARLRDHIAYGLTDRRLIGLRTIAPKFRKEWPLQDVVEIILDEERRDGSGDLSIVAKPRRRGGGEEELLLEHVDGVRAVEQRIREAVREAGEASITSSGSAAEKFARRDGTGAETKLSVQEQRSVLADALPPGASVYVDGRDRMLEFPRGLRNHSLWVRGLIALIVSIGGFSGFVFGAEQRVIALLVGVGALVMVIMTLHELLTHTRIAFTSEAVTIVREAPFHRREWSSAPGEFDVDEEVGKHKSQHYLDLYVGEDVVRVMQGFPRQQIEQTRVVLEGWTK